MTTPTPELTAAETERLTRRGLRLAQFTVGYNVAAFASWEGKEAWKANSQDDD